jgi:hypothetical protein
MDAENLSQTGFPPCLTVAASAMRQPRQMYISTPIHFSTGALFFPKAGLRLPEGREKGAFVSSKPSSFSGKESRLTGGGK